MNDIPLWVWIAASVGAIAALATTGTLVDAAIGGALWFGVAVAVAHFLARDRA